MREEKNMGWSQEETLGQEASLEQEEIITEEEKGIDEEIEIQEKEPENLTSHTEEPEKKGKKKKSLGRRIFDGVAELLLYVVIALVCIFVIPKYVVQRTEVSGESMEMTLMNKDSILVEKVSYRFHKPERFDVVVFYHFLDENNQDKSDDDAYEFYVKRIIGLPGETVQIDGETILINGQPLEENFGKDPITYEGVAEEPIVLGEDEYFVLGDNREVSKDSRYEEVGNIKENLIIGRAWVRVYPFNKMKFLMINGNFVE